MFETEPRSPVRAVREIADAGYPVRPGPGVGTRPDPYPVAFAGPTAAAFVAARIGRADRVAEIRRRVGYRD